MSNDNVVGATRTIKASEFKAKCLKLMDEVADSGHEIVITKNGRPVSRLVPYREKPKSLFGIDKGRIEILGDIIEPGRGVGPIPAWCQKPIPATST